MTRLDLEVVRDIVFLVAGRMGVEDAELPTFGISEQTGRPHIEVGEVYHYVVAERGEETRRWRTDQLDQLLYWIFADASSAEANRYTMAHRRNGEDGRQQSFPKQVELMGRVSQDWARTLRREQADILVRHPFTD